jgi:diguanylate cyclase (GGDEF)-like protein
MALLMPQESRPTRLLLIEDVEGDAQLSLSHLKRAGLNCIARRVETEPDLRTAIDSFSPDLILSDFTLPQFDGLAALDVARELAPEVPFIFVSGTIGEERAVNALLRGAFDYVLKSNLLRLPSVVRRALKDVQIRRERKVEQQRLARLDRVLRMLSGINAVMVRARDRKELLNEICRLAVWVGGYASAMVLLSSRPGSALQMQACSGGACPDTDVLKDALLEQDQAQTGLIQQALRAKKEVVCNDVAALQSHDRLKSVLDSAYLRSVVLLPILLEDVAVGVLALASHDADVVSAEELRMLREVSGNLSFTLQYLHKDTAVRFLSNYNPFTGLANRSLFCEQLSQLLEQPARRFSRCAVAIFDLARLTLINDSFGRRIGDLLLQQVASRFKQRFAPLERIGHFGGGTFAVVLEFGSSSLDEITLKVREHEAALFNDPFSVEEHFLPVGIRSGLAVYPEHSKDAASLVQNAETALRKGRESGERQSQYSQQQQTELLSRLALEQRLRLAVQRNEFELFYQPKVNVVSRRIEGVEALLRWRDPQSGLISPAEFLPVLESTGLILDVGDWVIRRAADDCQHWLNAGSAPIRVAVNVSPSQLHLPDFVDNFLKVLASCSVAGAGLDIEITEGTLQEEFASEVGKLKVLRSAGVRVAIDDFGTGYSSLGRLAKLPIDTLKIDRSFVCEVSKDYVGRMLVKTIISLARAFRLTTVAEGVESQEELNFLWQAGCDQSQGFLHSRPLPRDEFMSLMQHGNGRFVLPPETTSAQPVNASMPQS